MAAASWSQLIRKYKGKRRARAAIASGAWNRVHPGVYVDAAQELTWEVKAQAALKWHPRGVLSHRAAAALHGLEFGEKAVQLTVPKSSGARSTADVRVFRSELPWPDRTMLQGLRCTTLPRTLLDLAPALSFIDLAIAVEDAWRERSSALEALEKILRRKSCRGRLGARMLRIIVEDCRERGKPLRSALEVRMWWLLKTSGLPMPVPGHRVSDDLGEMEIDFAWVDLKIGLETDGKKFHPRDRFDADAIRQSRLVAIGWRVPRFTYAAIVFRPEQVLTLVSAALAWSPDNPIDDPFEIPTPHSGDAMEDVEDPFEIPPRGPVLDSLIVPDRAN